MGFAHHHHHPPGGEHPPLHDNYGPEARYAVEREAGLPTTRWEAEIARGLEYGLPGADSIVDKRIPTFSRGELPHFAGINTFLKAPYVEDVRTCGEYDVAVLGAPFDGGTTYRSGTRFGPQGIRRISALYGPYSFELGVDLRESITIGDAGDVLTIPGNIEKSFDQISKAAGHVHASGAFPGVLGGEDSIGYPEIVEVSPPYDHADITSALANRVVLEVLSGMARRRRDAAGGPRWDPLQPLLDGR
jgi:agmatinase